MSIFKCKMCGGTLEIQNNETVAVCEYCGTKQTLPRLNGDRKLNLYDRASHFRRNNEFDKAMAIYEQVLTEDSTDSESYWSLVLCRYGIEYVEDPQTRKRIPTVNRAQFTSIFDDEDYKSALQYADVSQREIYESEAKDINEIQKGILAISQKEEPFDVFICYKETDNNGRRTQDSVLATELYHELTKEGFKVFFSRITLEDKLGVAYEPYIFAALHSAKVMVALGTKPEHFNAVWVKNEWSRYLSLIKNGANKILIPAYRDMDPYDLPEEFSHLQAQDMSKLGFMQDLVRGIKKLVSADGASGGKETVVVQSSASGNASALVKRGFLALEDGEWEKADEFFEQALNQNAEDAQAYLGKLMVELKVKKQDGLANCAEPFDNSNNYKKVIRFADSTLSTTLNGYISNIKERNALKSEEERKEKLYYKAMDAYKSYNIERIEEAVKIFSLISGWKDSDEKVKICREKIERIKIDEEKQRMEREKQAEVERLENERRAEQNKILAEERKKRNKKLAIIVIPSIVICIVGIIFFDVVILPSQKYNKVLELMETQKYEEEMSFLFELGNYKNSKQLLDKTKEYYKKFENLISSDYDYVAGVKSDGTVIDEGDRQWSKRDVSNWKDVVSVSAGWHHVVGLKSDGTVVASGDDVFGETDTSSWTDIVSISVGNGHTVGLKSNGMVVAIGNNNQKECDVSDWKDIIAISAGGYHTIGLKPDGTVVAVGDNSRGQCNVSDWKDIVAVAAGEFYTVGLKTNGTVVAVGDNKEGQCDVVEWENIVSISAGNKHTVGLKIDGTVVAVGDNVSGQCKVNEWKNIVAISAGYRQTFGLKADGTLVSNFYGVCDVSDWDLIK